MYSPQLFRMSFLTRLFLFLNKSSNLICQWSSDFKRKRQLNMVAALELAQKLQLRGALAASTLWRDDALASWCRRYLVSLEKEVTEEEMARQMQQSLQDEESALQMQRSLQVLELAGRMLKIWGFEKPLDRPPIQEAPTLGDGNSEAKAKTTKVGIDCPICCEDTPEFKMFRVKSCCHKFCVDCLSYHVKVQANENLVPVKCPMQCPEDLEFDECAPFLPVKVLDLFARRLTESTIPPADRVYCPFPNCSAFMSKELEINLSLMASSSIHPPRTSIGACECLECHRLFCVECQVPWHADLSCADYQRRERDAEDIKLHVLARNKKWQRCKKCQNMIELATGCNHMTCRCGFEFCYLCGAKWKNKKASCKCKLWDVNNLVSRG